MSYLQITSLVQSSESLDFSGLSSTPSLPAYGPGLIVHLTTSEFLLAGSNVTLFPNTTSAANVRDCVIQAIGDQEIILIFNGVTVAVVPRGGTMHFGPIFGAANQLKYAINTNGGASAYVRVISTTLDVPYGGP